MFFITMVTLVGLLVIVTFIYLLREMIQDNDKLPYVIWLLLLLIISTFIAWAGHQLYLEL